MIIRNKSKSGLRFVDTEGLLNLSLVLLCSTLIPAAHADIYKCADEFGNVAYLQMPCPAERVDTSSVVHDDDVPVAEVEQDEAIAESSSEPQLPEPGKSSSRRSGEPLDVCKKRYRDQIDEIDAEIRAAFSPAKSDAYKKRLLVLTQQLRACE